MALRADPGLLPARGVDGEGLAKRRGGWLIVAMTSFQQQGGL